MLARLIDMEIPPGATAMDRNKAAIYSRICTRPKVTRKQMATELGMRPATVSDLVAEMLEDGLVRECDPVAANRKGRREIPLVPVADRFAVAALHVVSNEVRGVLVDLSGAVLAERKLGRQIDAMGENQDIEDLFVSLAEDLVPHLPPSSELRGIGLALPGIVDELNGVWIFSARWPRMQEMRFDGLSRRAGLPVRVTKNLNAELDHHLAGELDARDGGVLFVHWGFGIGASYALDGQIMRPRGGGFGELGHWIAGTRGNRECLCGKRGCLETEAALWALLPELRTSHPDAPGDEWAFEAFLHREGVADHPAIRRATERFVDALHDLQMILCARKIVITGPFAQNSRIFEAVWAGLGERLPKYARTGLELATARHFAMGEINGAATPFFEAALREFLIADIKDDKGRRMGESRSSN